jgi:KUP system potassium uptake protein
MINAVKNDNGIMFEATNLVFPTRSDSCKKLDLTVYHSLFMKKPRKADVIWFLHLDILNEPWGVHYSVNEVIDKTCYYVSLQLGFKEEHRIEYMMRKIYGHMVEKGELTGESVFQSVRGKIDEIDFKFMVINSRVAMDNALTSFQQVCVKAYRFVKSTGLKPAEDFGLDKTNVLVDFIPVGDKIAVRKITNCILFVQVVQSCVKDNWIHCNGLVRRYSTSTIQGFAFLCFV